MSAPARKWRYGCDQPVAVYVPRGWDYREIELPCGSTGPDGEVVQCDSCARHITPPRAPAYGDDL